MSEWQSVNHILKIYVIRYWLIVCSYLLCDVSIKRIAHCYYVPTRTEYVEISLISFIEKKTIKCKKKQSYDLG